VDYDRAIGVEHQGRVALVAQRDGGSGLITFRSAHQAAAWSARVQTGLQARNDALRSPPQLARLADGLKAAATAPWATPNHVLAVLAAALRHASVSTATLEQTDVGVTLRCRRFGRLHLGGTLPRRTGAAILETLDGHLAGQPTGRVAMIGGFPGPELHVDVERLERGVRLRPVIRAGLFQDLPSWGAAPDSVQMLRELLGRGPGLVLVTGRRGSGKSTLAEICAAESRHLRLRVEALIIDEIDGLATVHEALSQSVHRLVIATIRAADGSEAVSWLRSLGLDEHGLDAAVDGILETSLGPIPCPLCHGDGCDHCQRCGVIGQRGHVSVARLDAALREPVGPGPLDRERRKLTA